MIIDNKFRVGDKVRIIGEPDWGTFTVTQVDTVCTIIDSVGVDDVMLAHQLAFAPVCGHIDGGEILDPDEGTNIWVNFKYCPECGEAI